MYILCPLRYLLRKAVGVQVSFKGTETNRIIGALPIST